LALDAVPLKVPVMVPVEKLPLPSLLTIVFAVLFDVAEFTDDATVVIVDELTPPTLFTTGKSAVPPKSFANFNLPFVVASASGVTLPSTCALTKAVVAICVELLEASAVTAVGVPVKAGLVDNTTDPVPVELLVPVPPLAILSGVVKLNEVAVIVPVFNEVEEMFPVDTTDVAVIVPAAKLPLPSLLTIVFDVLLDVAEFTDDATVVIVDELTPPTLFTVAAAVTFPVPLNAGLVYVTSPVVDIVLPVVNAFALDAVPLKVPVKFVDVTELSPVTFVNVPPKLIVVDPRVIALLASCVLSIPAVADKLPDVMPVADIVPPDIDIPEPAVSAPCFPLKLV